MKKRIHYSANPMESPRGLDIQGAEPPRGYPAPCWDGPALVVEHITLNEGSIRWGEEQGGFSDKYGEDSSPWEVSGAPQLRGSAWACLPHTGVTCQHRELSNRGHV